MDQGFERYCELLLKIQRDLDGLIYEIESETTHKISGALGNELVVDAVPILRRLKDARRYADESHRLYSQKLKKLSK